MAELSVDLEGWNPYNPGRGVVLIKDGETLDGRGPNRFGLTDLYEAPNCSCESCSCCTIIVAIRDEEVAHFTDNWTKYD